MSDDLQALQSQLASARAEAAELRALLSQTQDGYICFDRRGNIIDVNPAYCELSGYSREQLLQLNLSDVQANMEPADVLARIREVPSVGCVRFENRHRRQDGTIIDLEISASAVGVGDQQRVAAFVRDVTEQRQTMVELMRNSVLLTKIQELANLGIWRWDIGGDRLTWSAQLFAIYGLDPKSFNASFEGYLSRVHPDDRERVRVTVTAAVELRHPFAISERIVRPSGEVRWLRSWGGVVLSESGERAAMFGACLDLTDQHRAQQSLRDTVAELKKQLDDS